MTALIMDGKLVAEKIHRKVAAEIARLVAYRVVPQLAVVLIGKNPSSAAYVRHKTAVAKRLGITLELIELSDRVSEEEVVFVISELNESEETHGILLQLPLPPHLNKQLLLQAISPHKDVDGLQVVNMGNLFIGRRGFVPCTPAAVMAILDYYEIALAGARAVVLGRSVLVGKPVRELLEARNATVTTCHSKTPYNTLCHHLEHADIVVAAMGQPRSITGDMLRPCATVIDVGITQVDGHLVGDVDFASAVSVADCITPVPGGVGPVTVAMLMQNTVAAARQQETVQCLECELPATWVRLSQFSGKHPYCQQHAEAQEDFGKSDPSSFFWDQITNP